MEFHLIYTSAFAKPGGIVVSMHSTAERRRRLATARKRTGKESFLPFFLAAIIASMDGVLTVGEKVSSLPPSGDTIRRYLAKSFTLVAAVFTLTRQAVQKAVAAFRAGAIGLLSKTRLATGARREWVQRQLVYAGRAAMAGGARNAIENAASSHRETAGRVPLAASWRLVLVERMTRILRPDSPFEWDEYDWRHSMWGRRVRIWPGVLAGVGLLVVVLVLAFVLASRATNSAQARLHPVPTNVGTAAPSGIIVEQPAGAGSPTPAPVLYQIGAWVSDSTPSGGSVKVFVRVSSQTKPVPNVPVTISVDGGGPAYSLGPTKTDADGLAIFTVNASGRGQPVFVTATAVVAGQTLTHQTTFFPQ